MEGRILDYGQVPTNQKRWFRRTIRIIVLLGFAAAVYFLGPPTWRWMQFLFWQNRCLGYTAPRDHVVFDFDVAHRQLSYCDAVTAEARLQDFGGCSSGLTFHGTLFLHEMRQPNGAREVVWADVGMWGAPTEESSFSVQIGANDLNDYPPPYRKIPSNMQSVAIPPSCRRFKVFAGQVDASNPSHFTFDYDTDGTRHTVDAWLNNQDQLLISPRP